MDSFIVLCREDAQKFAQMARSKAGRVLYIYSPDKVETSLVNAGGFCCNSAIPCKINGINRYIKFIAVANCINIDLWRKGTGSMVLDKTKVPETLIYDYIIHHEIAHAINSHSEIQEYYNKIGKDHKFINALRYSHEMVAEIYAWQQIMPGKTVPLRVRDGLSTKQIMRSFDKFLTKHRKEFKALCESVVPIPIDTQIEFNLKDERFVHTNTN